MKRGAPDGQRSKKDDNETRPPNGQRRKPKRNAASQAGGPTAQNSPLLPALKPIAQALPNNATIIASSQPIPKLIPGYYWDAEKRRYFKGKPPALPALPAVNEDSSFVPLAIGIGSHQVLAAFSSYITEAVYRCVEQPHANSMVVALAQYGLCIADLTWEAPTETLGLHTRHLMRGVTTIRWNPASSEFLAAVQLGDGTAPGYVSVLKVTDAAVSTIYGASEKRGSLWTIEWSPDGGSYAIGRTGGGMVFDLENSKCTAFLKTTMSDIFAVAYTHSKGNVVLHGDRSGIVRSHDLRSSPATLRDGSHLPLIKLRSSTCAMHLMRDPHYLITGGLKDELVMWDRRMHRQVAHYRGHVTSLARLSFSLDPTECFVAAYGSDDRLRIWDVRGGEAISVMRTNSGKAGYRPLWTEHWGRPSLLAGDGDLCLWHL